LLAVYGNNNRLTAAKIIRRNGMKNWKLALLAIITIFGIIIGFTACDKDVEQEQPREHPPETIYFGKDDALFTDISSVKLLLDAEWDAVKSKLITALNTAISSNSDVADSCSILFNGMVNIYLMEPQGYNYYKVTFSPAELFLNADYVLIASADDLSAKMALATDAFFGIGSEQE
jgi:hypothetical protein